MWCLRFGVIYYNADLLYVVSKVSSEYCFPVKCKVGLSWLTDSSVTTRISCSKWAKTTSSKDLSTWRWETLGNHQSKRIAFCQCEAPVVTILHLQLWPGSPDRPTTAFHFRLMDMAVDKFIHCQVSLQELSDVLELKRFFKYQLQHLNKYCLAIGNGSNCPICPKCAPPSYRS